MDGQRLEERISVLEAKVSQLERDNALLKQELADSRKKEWVKPTVSSRWEPQGAPFEP